MTASIVIAHIAGIPLEELVPLAYGGGAVWLAARVLGSDRAVMVRRRLRRLRPQRVDRDRDLSTGRHRGASHQGKAGTAPKDAQPAANLVSKLVPDSTALDEPKRAQIGPNPPP
jgi:hypothetical protein